MWILVTQGPLQPGDEERVCDVWQPMPGWRLARDLNNVGPVRRKVTSWDAVTHAIKTELIGKDKEGCVTTEHFWDCECDEDYIHSSLPATWEGKCDKCGATEYSQPDSRLAEAMLKMIEEAQK